MTPIPPIDVDGHAAEPRKLREECGVFALVGNREAAAYGALALHALQHRGQEGAGIVARDRADDGVEGADEPHFRAHKAAGLVGEVFNADAAVLGTG